MLGAMHRALKPSGTAILQMGDGQLGPRRVPAIAQFKRLAPAAGMALVAAASQPRTDWQGGHAREEHLLLLRARPESRG